MIPIVDEKDKETEDLRFDFHQFCATSQLEAFRIEYAGIKYVDHWSALPKGNKSASKEKVKHNFMCSRSRIRML